MRMVAGAFPHRCISSLPESGSNVSAERRGISERARRRIQHAAPRRGEHSTVAYLKAAFLGAARNGRESGRVPAALADPGALDASARLPAFRLVVALAFLVPGGLLVLAGLALLYPWLRRFTASPQPVPRPVPAVLQESPAVEARESNEHVWPPRGAFDRRQIYHAREGHA